MKTQDRIKNGISFVPQIKNIFTELTVQENLEMGAFINDDDIKSRIEDMYDLSQLLKRKKINLLVNYLEVKDNKYYSKSVNDKSFCFNVR